MFSQFLDRVLTESSLKGGCGMSARPGFYSGRGATSSDLNSKSLERIFQAIVRNVSAEAGTEFVKMVADIPVLSATDFLLTLGKFEQNNFVWSKALLSDHGGRYFENKAEAFGTVMEALSSVSGRRAERHDETSYIRGEFLRSHNVKPKPGVMDKYGYGGYGYGGYDGFDGGDE